MHESDLDIKVAERFSRQIIVPIVGTNGQLKIQNTKILVVGCGGLGCPLILYLSTCGISTLGIADHDFIEIHNLQRQVLFKESELGRYKAECAAEFIKNANSSINLNVYKFKIDNLNCGDVISKYDIVVDCTDSIETRYLLSDYTKKHNKEFICASVIRWEGHLYVFKKNGPCYRCLFPKIKTEVTSCDDNGVIGPICGVFGSLLGLEVLKCILGHSDTKLLTYNGITDKFATFKLRNKNSSCLACNGFFEQLTYEKPNCNTKQSCCTNISEIFWEDVLIGEYTIIDVRSRVQYDMFRIKNSISIPFNILSNCLDDIRNYKKIAVICKRGITSMKACKLLAEHGISSVSIHGGIDEYKTRYFEK